MIEAIHNLMQQLTRMQWSDYLDIAVVAFLIYKLLPLVRAPGTMRIARAVIAVMVVAGLAAALRLYTLSFILNQFMAVGLLALVILCEIPGFVRLHQAYPGSGDRDCPDGDGL